MGSRGRKLFFVLALSCVAIAGVAGYGDFREVWRHLVNFPMLSLMSALALALVNYVLRYLRWAYFLKILGLSVPLKISILVFLTGLAMTITPGKVGELVKSTLLKDRVDVPVSASAPVVLMERLTDLASVALMGLVGLAFLPIPITVVLAVIFAGAAIVAYLLTTRYTNRVLGWPVIRRWSEQIGEARQAIRELSRPGPICLATLLGFLAWVSEGVALWVVLKGLGADIGLILSLPIYAGSVLVGAATTLPGGLVGTEGTMVAVLQQLGVERHVAAAGTLLVRVATLWFAVAVGFTAWGWLHWFVPAREMVYPRKAAIERAKRASGEGNPDE